MLPLSRALVLLNKSDVGRVRFIYSALRAIMMVELLISAIIWLLSGGVAHLTPAWTATSNAINNRTIIFSGQMCKQCAHSQSHKYRKKYSYPIGKLQQGFKSDFLKLFYFDSK